MNNLQLDSNWDIIIGRGTARFSGAPMVAQLVKSRLLTLLGEWQQDTSIGLPWFDSIFGKNSRVSDIQSALANVIRTTPHVLQLVDLQVNADYRGRTLTVTFNALSDFGDVNEIIEWQPQPTV
ncbi:baseplate wedge subunit [Erwinia phage Faunus]|uniref:Putative structural protein n=1 Tax=Erwinia phage Faunus TaxID=2182346 RepID=A0A2U8UWL6_9CAUD|nr:baseplate wedge subunit [Erwinia phage Faunus]AWN08651.1 putative structural protein [Erwinia phage Faunus]